MQRGSLASLLVAAAVTAAVAAPVAVKSLSTNDRPASASTPGAWIHSWTAMPQLTEPGNLPPAPFTQADRVLVDSTVRQTVHVSLGGALIRVRFSNAFGGSALPITAATVALPLDGRAGVSAIRPGSTRTLTFDGRPSVTVPVGAQVVSDPLPFAVAAQSNLTVTTYLATGQLTTNITSHPGSRTTSYLVAGDHVDADDLAGATPVDHWYFISGLEAWEPQRAAGVVMLGDSLTDGRGSTTNQNNRWPDQLLQRLQADRRTADVAVLNQAAGGNRVLNDGLGPNALARLDRDVLAHERGRLADRLRGRQRHRHRRRERRRPGRRHGRPHRRVRPDRHARARAGHPGVRRHDHPVRRQHRLRRSGRAARAVPAAGEHVDPDQPPVRRGDRLRPRPPGIRSSRGRSGRPTTSATTCTSTRTAIARWPTPYPRRCSARPGKRPRAATGGSRPAG